jgi:hypothetical protein
MLGIADQVEAWKTTGLGLARRFSGLGLDRIVIREGIFPNGSAVSRRNLDRGSEALGRTPYWPGEIATNDDPCAVFWRPG